MAALHYCFSQNLDSPSGGEFRFNFFLKAHNLLWLWVDGRVIIIRKIIGPPYIPRLHDLRTSHHRCSIYVHINQRRNLRRNAVACTGWLSKNRDENPRMRKFFNSPKGHACADSRKSLDMRMRLIGDP